MKAPEPDIPKLPVPQGKSPLSVSAHAGFTAWRAAMLWQRTVNRALKPLRLTHTQLLVLDATQVAQDPNWDGVPQSAIARVAGLDVATTSAVLRALEKRSLVDRGEGGDARSWGVLITKEGKRLLHAAAPLVEFRNAPRISRR